MSDNNRTYSEESGFFDILKSIMGRNPKKSKKKVLKNGSIVDSDYKYQKPAENTMGMTPADYAKFRKAVMFGNDEQNTRENLAKYFENNPKIKDMLTEADRIFNSIPKSEGDAQTRYRAALTKAMSDVDDPELNKLARVRKFSDSKINVLVNDYDSGKFTPADAKGKNVKGDSVVDDMEEEDFSESLPPLKPTDLGEKEYKSFNKDTLAKPLHVEEKVKDVSDKQKEQISDYEQEIGDILSKNGLTGDFKAGNNNGFSTVYDYKGTPSDLRSLKKLADDLSNTLSYTTEIVHSDGKREQVEIYPTPTIRKKLGSKNEYEIIFPNKDVSLSYNTLSDKLDKVQEKNPDSVQLLLGMGDDGVEALNLNDPSFSHMVVLGSSGSGKTQAIKAALLNASSRYKPDEFQMIVIDNKGLSFKSFSDSPSLRTPPIRGGQDPEALYKTLKQIVKEMRDRNALFEKEGIEDVQTWNKKHPDKKLPQMAIVTDELGGMLTEVKRYDKENKTDFYDKIASLYATLGQESRSSGVHTITMTQNPQGQDLKDTKLWDNASHVLAGRLTKNAAGAADMQSARQLKGRGDLILRTPEGETHLQGLMVNNDEIRRVTKEQNARNKLGVQPYKGDPKKIEESRKLISEGKDPYEEEKPVKEEKSKEETKKELKKLDDELKDAYIQPIKDALNEIDPDDLDTLKDAVEKMSDVKKNLDKRGIEVPEEITDIMEKFKPVMESGDDYERAFNLKKFLKGNVPENEWVQEQEDKESKLEKLPKNIKEAGKKRQQKESKKEPDYDLDVEEDEEDDVDNKVQKKMTKDKGNLIKQIQTFENKYKNKEGKPSKFNRVTEEKKKDFDDRLAKRKQQLSKKQSGLNRRKSNPDIIKRLKESIDKAKERQRISDNITKYEDEYSDRTGKDVKFRRTSKIVDDID